MNKREIFRKIGGIISELTEQYQYLSDNTEDINDLELELFVANSNFLTDHIEILRKLNSAGSNTQKTEAGSPLPSLQESVRITLNDEDQLDGGNIADKQEEEKPSTTPSEVSNEKEEFAETSEHADPKNVERDAVEDRPVDSGPAFLETEDVSYNNTFENAATLEVPRTVSELESFERIEEPISEQSFTQGIAGSTFADAETTDVSRDNTFEQAATIEAPESVQQLNAFRQNVEVDDKHVEQDAGNNAQAPTHVPTINDLISAQRRPLVEPVSYNKKPVSDLKSGINLNDKLSFIKDLFNGYSLAYSEAIELLNRFDSLDAADKFLHANYAQKNNWSAKQSTVDKFYEILERRFAK